LRIRIVNWHAVVLKFAARRERPFLVGWQPVLFAGLARQPACIGIRVVPADLDRGTVGRNDDAALDRAAGAFIDTALIVGGADLMLHDRQRLGEAHR
jgi:hypothetical protein